MNKFIDELIRMAQNFQSLTRHIIGDSYCIGGSVIIDKNSNINIPRSTIAAQDAIIKRNAQVCGIFQTDKITSKTAQPININGVSIDLGSNIIASSITGNLISGSITVDNLTTDQILPLDGNTLTFQSNIALESRVTANNKIEIRSMCGIGSNALEITGNTNVLGNLCIAPTIGSSSGGVLKVERIAPPKGNVLVIDGTVQMTQNLDIDGDLTIGNFCVDSFITNAIAPKNPNNKLVIAGNLAIDGAPRQGACPGDPPRKTCGLLCVDQIKEQNIGKGVCVGYPKGKFVLATTLTTNVQNNVTGDALWQSFYVPYESRLCIIEPFIVRSKGFEMAPMTALVYKGIGGFTANLIGSVTVSNYSTGNIDMSDLELDLTPGDYTLLLDFPTNNLSNYMWLGHEKQLGEPVGVDSDATLHLKVYGQSKGQLKVQPCFTRVENLLQLELPDESTITNTGLCAATVISVDPTTNAGIFGNGLITLDLECGGNIERKTLSFDNCINGGVTLLIDKDVFVNGNLTSLSQETLFGNNIQVSGNAEIDQTLIVGGTSTLNRDVQINANLTVGGNLEMSCQTISNVSGIEVGNISSKGGTLCILSQTNFKGNDIGNVGNIKVQDNLVVGGDLTFQGDLTVNGNVQGNLNLNLNQNLTVKGNATILGNLTVESDVDFGCNTLGNVGKVQLTSISSKTAPANINVLSPLDLQCNDLMSVGNITTKGGANIGGNLTVGNNATTTLTGNLVALLDSEFTGDVTIVGNLVVNRDIDLRCFDMGNVGTLGVGNLTSKSQSASVCVLANLDLKNNNIANVANAMIGNLTVINNANVTNDLEIGGNIIIGGNIELQQDLDLACNDITNVGTIFVGNINTKSLGNDICLFANLDLKNNDLLNIGNANIFGDFTVEGDTLLNGDTTINANLVVDGVVDLFCNDLANVQAIFVTDINSKQGGPSLVCINNNINMKNNDIEDAGNIVINNDLFVTNNVTVGTTIDVAVDLNVDQDACIGGDLKVTGNLDLTGNLNFGGNVDFVGDTDFNGPINLNCNDILDIGNLFAINIAAKPPLTLINFASDLNLNGNTISNIGLLTSENIIVNGNLTTNNLESDVVTTNVVTANVVTTNIMCVIEDANIKGDLILGGNVVGNLNVSEGLCVFGDANLKANLIVENGMIVGGNLSVSENAIIDGELCIVGNANVKTDLIVDANVFAGNVLLNGGGLFVNNILVVTDQQTAVADAAAATAMSVAGAIGAADGTLVAVGDTSTSNEGATINDNFTDMQTALNALITDVGDIRAQLNLLLVNMRAHGLIAP